MPVVSQYRPSPFKDSWTTANNIITESVRSIEKDSPRSSESRIYHTNEGECQALDKWPTIRVVGERGEFMEEVDSIEVGTK